MLVHVLPHRYEQLNSTRVNGPEFRKTERNEKGSSLPSFLCREDGRSPLGYLGSPALGLLIGFSQWDTPAEQKEDREDGALIPLSSPSMQSCSFLNGWNSSQPQLASALCEWCPSLTTMTHQLGDTFPSPSGLKEETISIVASLPLHHHPHCFHVPVLISVVQFIPLPAETGFN